LPIVVLPLALLGSNSRVSLDMIMRKN
jgi:hypothetical protein